jgi:hypothetical protein
MKETCETCRYCMTAKVKEEDGKIFKVDNWCTMKDRRPPKNPCRRWRPKAQNENCGPGGSVSTVQE